MVAGGKDTPMPNIVLRRIALLAALMFIPAGPAVADFKSDMLGVHNTKRAKHCVPALGWSASLAEGARAWAKKCKFQHSSGNYGENLAMGVPLSAKQAVRMWYNEVSSYNYSTGAFSSRTGHFTQVIWKNSTQVGCGKAQCNGQTLYVCRYSPPGNYAGEFKENVPRPCN
jgi:uncharacterized protein YkwD